MIETSRQQAASPCGAYTATRRSVETGALAALVWLTALVAPRAVDAAREIGAPVALAALVAGVLAADLLSGLGHWIGDTWGRASWPLVGNSLIRGFREHHVDPQEITRHDLVETNGSVWAVLVPVMAALLAIPAALPGASFAILFGTALGLALSVTNQVHKWAHEPKPPRLARILQRAWIVLPPGRHAVHHRAPFDCHYCITTGWWNGTLEAIGAFRSLERIVTRMTGAVARDDERLVVR